jgi:AraC-like DNA-binding protein
LQRTIEIESFIAARVSPQRRLAYWNELAASTYTPVRAEPLRSDDFAPELRRARLGDLRIGSLLTSACHVAHTSEHVRQTAAPYFFLQMQVEGETLHAQGGREVHLRPGDFTLLDNTRPYNTEMRSRSTMLVVGFPDALLRRHLGCPDAAVCVRMVEGAGLNSLLSQFLRSLWGRFSDGIDSASGHNLVGALIHLLSGAYGALPGARARPADLRIAARQRAISFIEHHLRDASLTPTKVAAACGMTPRHLHRVFSELEQTVSCYIWHRRLEECARVLAAPQHSGRTVGSIAVDYGFNSLKSFGRMFRERYNLTPTEYRKRHDPHR